MTYQSRKFDADKVCGFGRGMDDDPLRDSFVAAAAEIGEAQYFQGRTECLRIDPDDEGMGHFRAAVYRQKD